MNEDGLLATLASNPEPGALRVYADRVLEQGNVHGEFITLQLNRADRGSEPDVREEALRREVLEPALKEALGPSLTACRWEHGFLAAVEFDVDDAPFVALRTLVERPEAQLLRRIVLKALRWDAGASRRSGRAWPTVPVFPGSRRWWWRWGSTWATLTSTGRS